MPLLKCLLSVDLHNRTSYTLSNHSARFRRRSLAARYRRKSISIPNVHHRTLRFSVHRSILLVPFADATDDYNRNSTCILSTRLHMHSQAAFASFTSTNVNCTTTFFKDKLCRKHIGRKYAVDRSCPTAY